jgi:transcriptional regulator with XRE-family HTH domain
MESAVSKRKPKQIDICVGYNIHCIRSTNGLSQAELAEALNVSVTQIQKYEKGLNRISASRLYILAQVLGCDLKDLFEGCDHDQNSMPQMRLTLHEEARIINALRQLKDPITYQLILRFIENLAKNI